MPSGRKATTKAISEMVEQYLDPNHDPRIYWAKEVTFDYDSTHMVRVDYMRFKPVNNSVSGIEKGDFYCYEIKSSVEDFHSKNGHNFIGDYNYYVMPQEVYEAVKDEIPYNIGVMVPRQYGMLETIKKARRKDRSKPTSEMLMMMWRSSRREVVKERRATANAKDPIAKKQETTYTEKYVQLLLDTSYLVGYEDAMAEKAGGLPKSSYDFLRRDLWILVKDAMANAGIKVQQGQFSSTDDATFSVICDLVNGGAYVPLPKNLHQLVHSAMEKAAECAYAEEPCAIGGRKHSERWVDAVTDYLVAEGVSLIPGGKKIQLTEK